MEGDKLWPVGKLNFNTLLNCEEPQENGYEGEELEEAMQDLHCRRFQPRQSTIEEHCYPEKN